MHFYQNKHGRLVALLVLLLKQVHIAFQKTYFSKLSAVRDDLFALRISDPKLNTEQPLHSMQQKRGEASFHLLKSIAADFWLPRPKILDCPWAPSYSPPLP